LTTKTNGGKPPDFDPIRIPQTLTAVFDARDAIEVLMSCGAYWPGSKEQFAFKMEWLKANGEADRRRVEDVCNLTRDQEQKPPWVQETLAGFVIAYAPSQGGMVLIDPASGELPLEHYAHLLAGDLQRQQQHKTENRRRLPMWKKAGAVAMNSGDAELARLFWQGENEVSSRGVVSEITSNDLFRVLVSRGLKG